MGLSFDFVIGVGGIGKGIMFELKDNHTMGRNESRLANLTDSQDFCKLHIIMHYVSMFTDDRIPVYAIGKIGDDEIGKEVLSLMKSVGINTKNVFIEDKRKTLYSVCYQYPDEDGGNITTQNSASNFVLPTDIDIFFKNTSLTGKGIVLAAPEVQVSTRHYILKWGRKRNYYNIASLLSSEVKDFVKDNIFAEIDLLVINRDEMESILKFSKNVISNDNEENVFLCYQLLKKYNKEIELIVTLGESGVYVFSKEEKKFISAINTKAINTAGAGDCFLGSLIAYLIYNISIFEAAKIATVSAGYKVKSKNTIDFTLDKMRLLEFLKEKKISYSKEMEKYFE